MINERENDESPMLFFEKAERLAHMALIQSNYVPPPCHPLPPFPSPSSPQEQIGSRQPVVASECGYKLLEEDGYDDGGVADLALLVDLNDWAIRRKHGNAEYFNALANDKLPRIMEGPMSEKSRRDQKVDLVQLLFSENNESEDKGPAEIYLDHRGGNDDPSFMKQREQKLAQAKTSLQFSLLLREPALASLSLSELCKRRLAFYGKNGAEDALLCG